jgi:leucyl/phenylalanyl-tRNA--protein transferase
MFPDPGLADPDGLLAVGGDLAPERLLLAYRLGIFPWYSSDTPILWWSPDPRLVLFPDELRVSNSLRRVIKKGRFQLTADRAFARVIRECGDIRREKQEGTWLVPEMIEAYCRLHELGFAHSIEAWRGHRLVGGLYGVAIGRVYFGESMFARETDASKVALVRLVEYLKEHSYELVDCQVTTPHLQRFGAREISRREFIERLAAALNHGTPTRPWSFSDPSE